MKKVLTIAGLAVMLVLTGCGGVEERFSKMTEADFDVICLNGVEYYYRRAIGSNSGFMAVKYNLDGTVALCKG